VIPTSSRANHFKLLAVITGEEEEETIHHVRAKLYALCSQNQWKERGTGLLKVNVRRSDGGGARLRTKVMLSLAVFY